MNNASKADTLIILPDTYSYNETIKENITPANRETGVIISDNAFSGIQISTGARPISTKNTVSFNLCGIIVNDKGGGTLIKIT